MFKVLSAEIKKTVSKPGIYILAILLAIILILGAFIYKPKATENETVKLNGATYVQKYLYFNGDGSNNAGLKDSVQESIDITTQSVNNYSITVSGTTYNQKEYIEFLTTKFNEARKAYFDCAYDNNNVDMTYINQTARPAVISALTNLNNEVEKTILNTNDGSFTLITSKENYENYKKVYKEISAWAASSPLSKDKLKELKAEYETKYHDNLINSINEFKYPTLSKEFVKQYTSTENATKLSILTDRLNAIEKEIEVNYNLAVTNKNNENIDLANKMDQLANLYQNTAKTYVNLVKYELLSNAFSILDTKEQINALKLSDYSEYDSNTLLIKYNYLFKHNKNLNDYNRPLTIGIASGNETNAYDFSYFVLRLFSFVIIIYSIMSASHSIAGEVKEGSMRYLAIRPVSRTKLFFGKWLAILLMSAILIIFSSIIALCVGGAVYGFTSNRILTIFNSNVSITLHPLGMIAIYLLSMFLELMIYSAIAMLLSTLFKSDLLAVTLLIVLYLMNILLPIFVKNANSWLTFYPFSHISLYSLFGSSIYAVKDNFYNLLLGAKVYTGTHIALTISIITILIICVIALAIKVFKKKEL